MGGEQQVPGREQVPRGFILPLSLLQVPRLRGKEEERGSSYLGVGERAGQFRLSQLGSRTHLVPPLHFAAQIMQCLQEGHREKGTEV